MSLKRAAVRGVRWEGLSAAFLLLLMLVRLSVLARLLSPREFGLMSMVTVVLSYAQTYIDVGLSSAVIQKQENDQDKLSTLYWANILASLFMCAVVIALRNPASTLMREPALPELLLVVAFQLPIVAASQQFLTLFRRELEFRFVSLVQMATATVSTLVAIGLALQDFGVWALVISSMLGAALNSILLVIAGARRWPVRLTLQFRKVSSHLRFGLYELGKATIAAAATQIDSVLVGRYLGAGDLGVYSIAKQLVNIPRSRINPVLSRVSLSVFAKQQEYPERMVAALFTIQRATAYVNLPYLLGLIVVAPAFVPIFYGPRWTDVIQLVQILAVPLLLLNVSGPTQTMRVALGQVAFNFHWAWTTAVLQTAVIWYSVQYGVTVMAIARGAFSLLTALVLLQLTLRMVGKNTLTMLANLRPPALAATLMAAIVEGAFLLSAPLSNAARLAICVPCGVAVFALVALKLDGAFIREYARLGLARK